jgi:propanediol dehydratase small subunit
MSNCSKHIKMTDSELRVCAENMGDLHYESLTLFLEYLGEKLHKDATKDQTGGRFQLANKLYEASALVDQASDWIHEAWDISKPYMMEQDELDKN